MSGTSVPNSGFTEPNKVGSIPGEIVRFVTMPGVGDWSARCLPAATVIFMGPLLTSRRAVDLVRVGSALCCAAPGCPCPC